MLDKLLQDKDEDCRRALKRNQEIHMRAVEDAERKRPYGDPKGHQRFPHEFNKGYSPKKE